MVVAGAGIGGLTTALALAERGIPVRVVETAAAIRPLGVGINLLPHSVKILADLGLLEALEASAIPTAQLVYFNKFGQRIWAEPRGRAAGYPVPQLSIHRGVLQMALFDAVQARLGPGSVATGKTLVGFDDQGDRVTIRVADRATGAESAVEGTALIAADGIHSAVRKTLYPDDGPPRFSGRMLWRAVTETDPFLGGQTMIMAGHQDQKFVCYPIAREAFERGRSLTNWIAERAIDGEAPAPQDWNRAVPQATFDHFFETWNFNWLDVPKVVAGASAVYEFPMSDRDPLPRWSFGRVTLLGDAAHPMYPIGSNGASQAILDAAALADSLAGERAAIDALARYDEARREATAAIVLANRRNGPEQVMQIAEERAPHGFGSIDDVISEAELVEIAARYKRTAGFAHEQVAKK